MNGGSKLSAWITGRVAIDDDLAEEVRSHVEMETQTFIDRGMTPEAARVAARRHFGNTTAVAERAHDAWAFATVESLLSDVRYGFRAMRRSPAFSLVVILTFALGGGSECGYFQRGEYRPAEGLFHTRNPNAWSSSARPMPNRIQRHVGQSSVTGANGNHSFQEMAAFESADRTLTGRGDPITAREMRVTAPYFSLLGVRPALGRLLGEPDDLSGAPATIVLSYPFWAGQLGRRSSHCRRYPHTQRTRRTRWWGLLAPIWTARAVDYYTSLGRILGKPADRKQHQSIRSLARLKAGVTLASARAPIWTPSCAISMRSIRTVKRTITVPAHSSPKKAWANCVPPCSYFWARLRLSC